MAYNHEYPYVDPNRYNSDWLLNKVKELDGKMTSFEAKNTVTFWGEWNITNQYPRLAVVWNDNVAYLSFTPVPAGIEITNTTYWGPILDYGAEIDALGNLKSGDQTDTVISGDTWAKTPTNYTVEAATIESDSSVEGISFTTSDPLSVGFADGSKNIRMESCDVTGDQRGVSIQTVTTENGRILNNNIVAGKYGILENHSDVDGMIIKGNNITVAGGDGIELNGPDSTIEHHVISSNIVEDTQAGSYADAGFNIGCASADESVIANNVLMNATKHGVHIEDDSNDNIITSNVIQAPGLYGIWDLSFNGTNIVSGNMITGGRGTSFLAGLFSTVTQTISAKCKLLFNNVVRNCKQGIDLTGGHAKPFIGKTVVMDCDDVGYLAGSMDELDVVNCTNPLVVDRAHINTLNIYGDYRPATRGGSHKFFEMDKLSTTFEQNLTTTAFYVDVVSFTRCRITVSDNAWYFVGDVEGGTLNTVAAYGAYVVTYDTTNGIGLRVGTGQLARDAVITITYYDALLK